MNQRLFHARSASVLLSLTLFSVTIFSLITFSAALSPADAWAAEEVPDEDRSPIVGALLYLPNRVLDIFDIIRLRVRIGPGIAAGVRATEVATVYLGSYASVFAGLPGPRHEPGLPIPLGLESHNGMTVSVVDGTVDGGIGPDYGLTECGFGFQLAIIGIDFGIDPGEILDFVLGIVTLDPESDDF